MKIEPQFTMSFAIHGSNENRKEAFSLYHEAFGARNNGESYAGDCLHIMMEVYGVEILIGPGDKKALGYESGFNCEIRYSDEAAFRKAYDALSREGTDCKIEGPYPWAKQLGLLTDKFGIPWALYYNEEVE